MSALTADLAIALHRDKARTRNLKFIATFHHGFNAMCVWERISLPNGFELATTGLPEIDFGTQKGHVLIVKRFHDLREGVAPEQSLQVERPAIVAYTLV